MLPAPDQDRSIQQLYGALVESEERNAQVMDDILSALESGFSPLVLIERRDHWPCLPSGCVDSS
ncbi:hypothetical protein [Sediminicurvatus halobius]|uniref:Uncharacterized protein n=1 Tax=Sediminicurvatus halobius TaxID=2182432 RepID=A0A2U2MXI1_9GAMM|nr:hypothetical protein [Spiribacter halobius]PWG61590.1 hypothetical protein DEM34_15485 [Spiribacter halobius]UEX77269.1 hypothetical protein LMH63_15160 [Spiribacter halobius]